MKDRAYRRYMEEIVVLRRMRLEVMRNSFWRHEDVNRIYHSRPMVKDLIKTGYNYMFKTYTTNKKDTEYKRKYSQHRNKGYYYSRERNTRLQDKKDFKKLLKEYGIN